MKLGVKIPERVTVDYTENVDDVADVEEEPTFLDITIAVLVTGFVALQGAVFLFEGTATAPALIKLAIATVLCMVVEKKFSVP